MRRCPLGGVNWCADACMGFVWLRAANTPRHHPTRAGIRLLRRYESKTSGGCMTTMPAAPVRVPVRRSRPRRQRRPPQPALRERRLPRRDGRRPSGPVVLAVVRDPLSPPHPSRWRSGRDSAVPAPHAHCLHGKTRRLGGRHRHHCLVPHRRCTPARCQWTGYAAAPAVSVLCPAPTPRSCGCRGRACGSGRTQASRRGLRRSRGHVVVELPALVG